MNGEPVTAEEGAISRIRATDVGGGFLDILIDRAMARPRDIGEFVEQVKAAALHSDETAGDCLFGLPRAGKVIEGPSVRLAEILVPAWRYSFVNVQAMPVGPKDTEVTSVATFLDLQSITGIQIETKRRITTKEGKRYGEDMVVMTQNANNSVAYRNVVFKSIPRALWYPVYEQARVLALGEGGTIPEKRQQMIQWFGEKGIQVQQILARLKIGKVDDMNINELVTLKGLGNAIKEDEITAEEAFNVNGVLGDAPDRSALEDKLKNKNGPPASDQDIANRAKAKKAEGENDPEESAEPENGTPALASARQITSLKKFAGQFKIEEPHLLQHLGENYGVTSLEELPEEMIPPVKEWIQEQGGSNVK